jgi:hypothetical protein
MWYMYPYETIMEEEADESGQDSSIGFLHDLPHDLLRVRAILLWA